MLGQQTIQHLHNGDCKIVKRPVISGPDPLAGEVCTEMLNRLFCFTASDHQTTVAVWEGRATKTLTNVGAHRLRSLYQLLSMKEAPRAIREPSDSSSELLRRIGDGEIPVL